MKRMLLVLAVVSAILALSCDNPASDPPASDPPVQVVAPTAPTNVRIESGALLWNAVSGADSYRVFLSSDGSTWPATATASQTGTSFSPLAAGSYYAVTAVNTGGESTKSSPAVLSAPTVPTNVRIESDTLFWNAVSNADSYKVFLSSDGSTWPATAAANQTGTSFSPLAAGSYYTVTAVNGGGESAKSSPALYGAPPAPKNLTIINNNMLSWDAVPCATSYSVYYSSDNTVYEITQWTGVTATQQTVSDGDGGYYKVSALNVSSEGTLSDPVHKL